MYYHLSIKYLNHLQSFHLKQRLVLNTSYDQYIFKNENLSLFDGDAQYSLTYGAKK